MIIAALSLAAQLANPGFERGLEGWQTDRHRGMGIEIGSNRGYTIRQAAEGEQFLAMGWRARSGAPAEAFSRVSQQLDARRCQGPTRTESGFEVTTHGGRKGTGIDAVEFARKMVDRGAGEILLTSMDRDGARLAVDATLLTLAERVGRAAAAGLATRSRWYADFSSSFSSTTSTSVDAPSVVPTMVTVALLLVVPVNPRSV